MNATVPDRAPPKVGSRDEKTQKHYLTAILQRVLETGIHNTQAICMVCI
jgi:hypothetical protein